MKRIIFVVLLMLSLFATAQKKVAVYVTGDDPVNDIVANRLVDGLARNGKYTTVERTASFLTALSKEHSYEREGAVDDDEIAMLGRQFSVQYVCVASVYNVWQNDKYITARLIDVETAEVVLSNSSNGTITTSSELISALNSLSESFLNALESNNNRYGKKKVAVYVTKTGNRDVDVILGDQLVAGFARSGKYVAIERTNGFLSQISKEQGYQYSGMVDDDDLTRLGKQFGVQFVCVAKTTSWAGDYFISTRMIDVATGEVVNLFNVEGVKLSNSRNVVAVASEIATKLSGRTIKEEREFQEAEARRREQERIEQERRQREAEQRRKEEAERAEKARVQALIDKPWRDLLFNKVGKKVTHRWDSGTFYIGNTNDAMALYAWPKDQDIYCGYYDSDQLRTGIGMMIVGKNRQIGNCPNGMAYVGPWWNGKKQDDNGKVYDWNGNLIYYGRFKKGEPKDQYPSDASTLAQCPYVFKEWNYNNGDKYVGESLNGKRHGMGLYIWESGNAWYGEWKDGKKNGKGIAMWYDGGYKIGTWRNDELVNW